MLLIACQLAACCYAWQTNTPAAAAYAQTTTRSKTTQHSIHDTVPCENGSAETTVAEGGRNLVAGCWLSWLTRPTYFWSSSEANSLIFHAQRFCLPFSSLITLNFAIITPHVLTTWWKYYYVIGWDIRQYKINGSSASRLVLMLINRRLLLTNDLKQYSLQKHRTFEDMMRCTTLQTRKRRHKSR